MRILWFAWKDHTHPLAGGAEVIKQELSERLVQEGHEVIIIAGSYKKAKPKEAINGVQIVRVGGRVSVYYKSYRYYKKHLKGWADLVIEEVNTIPYMTQWYVKEPRVLFFHQLCREIWFYELPKYIGWIGYLAEPVYLRLLNKNKVITVSNSTKQDLIDYGFKADKINIISEGIRLKPVKDLESIKKFDKPTLLIHGSLRAMKRPLEAIKAFEIAKNDIAELKLKISGGVSDKYGESVLGYIKNSKYHKDIEYLGRVTEKQKIELMQKCHLILVASVREGWGLIVTEANSQGTPAVVYDVAGLRDSVMDGKTGRVSKLSPKDMAGRIVKILNNGKTYKQYRINSYNFSKTINFDNCYNGFLDDIKI